MRFDARLENLETTQNWGILHGRRYLSSSAQHAAAPAGKGGGD
jgi:hypothetical protein